MHTCLCVTTEPDEDTVTVTTSSSKKTATATDDVKTKIVWEWKSSKWNAYGLQTFPDFLLFPSHILILCVLSGF